MIDFRRILYVVLTAAALALPCAVQALTVTFRTPLGDVVEDAWITAYVAPSQPVTSCLRGSYSRTGDVITLKVQAGSSSCGGVELFIGKLEVGTYSVHASLVDRNGVVLEQSTSRLKVLPLEGRCNDDPLTTPAVYGFTLPEEEAQRVAELAADAEFAARFPGVHAEALTLGQVAIHAPPLQDVPPIMVYLDKTYAWLDGWNFFPGAVYRNAGNTCNLTGRDVEKAFLEFVNLDAGTYLYTADPDEMAGLDAGTWGRWAATGYHFVAIAHAACARETGLEVVYRFARATGDTRTHVFTRDREECYAIDKGRAWHFQGAPFFAAPTQDDGTCAESFDKRPRIPLYRLWRPFGETAHRLTTLRSVVDEMTAQGWVDEGARMCVPPGG